MLKLYDYLDSGNGYKIRLLLSQLGTPFELQQVDILKGESRTASFLAMNPNGKIPLLELEDGSYLSESNAILCYLAQGTQYLPDHRLTRALALQWLFFEQYSHEPNIATRRFLLKHADSGTTPAPVLAQKLELGYRALNLMEQHLAKTSFMVGNAYTIADIALFAYTHLADEGGFDLANYSQLRAWCDRVKSQQGFRGFYSVW